MRGVMKEVGFGQLVHANIVKIAETKDQRPLPSGPSSPDMKQYIQSGFVSKATLGFEIYPKLGIALDSGFEGDLSYIFSLFISAKLWVRGA